MSPFLHLNRRGAVDLTNWRTSPANRWAFRNVEEIIDTTPVANDPANVRVLALSKQGLGSSLSCSLFLTATGTDAVVALHDGQIVYERYARGNQAHTRHILMSSTKAVIGLLAEMLHAKGRLNLDAPVSNSLPEMQSTPFEGATLRHLLDMRTSVVLNAVQTRDYELATNWEPRANGADLASFFRTLKGPLRAHGTPFSYVSANTDLAGWVIERATGKTIAALLSDELWRPMGAEFPAHITIDGKGLARSAGGFCATARDFARIGQLIVDNGGRDGRQIIPEAAIAGIVNDGDPDAWTQGQWGKSFAAIGGNMRYRSGWYLIDDRPKTMFAMGIYGQNLFIDRENRIVVAKFSSWNKPVERLPLWLTHRAFDRFRRAFAPARVRADHSD